MAILNLQEKRFEHRKRKRHRLGRRVYLLSLLNLFDWFIVRFFVWLFGWRFRIVPIFFILYYFVEFAFTIDIFDFLFFHLSVFLRAFFGNFEQVADLLSLRSVVFEFWYQIAFDFSVLVILLVHYDLWPLLRSRTDTSRLQEGIAHVGTDGVHPLSISERQIRRSLEVLLLQQLAEMRIDITHFLNRYGSILIILILTRLLFLIQ